MYFIITAMLWFGSTDVVTHTEYPHATFDSVPTCQEFLFKNKVNLIKDIFEAHDDGTMWGIEFFCESRTAPKAPKGPEVWVIVFGAGTAERGSRFTDTINAQIVAKTWTSAVKVSVA